MDGKIKKCEKDLQSLYQTMTNLKERNDKLKISLKDKKSGNLDKAKVHELQLKLDKESKEMWERKNELEKINYAMQEGTQTLKEKESQIVILKSNLDDLQISTEKIKKEVNTKKEQFERSEKKYHQVINNSKVDVKISDIGLEIDLNNEMLRYKFLKNAVIILCNEIPEMRNILSNSLQEVGIEIGSKPVSEKALSEISRSSLK